MAETVYRQMTLNGSGMVGFRNHSDEPWLMYRTPLHEAYINMASDKSGYTPRPEWTPIDG